MEVALTLAKISPEPGFGTGTFTRSAPYSGLFLTTAHISLINFTDKRILEKNKY